ncbi:metal ABC transporter substrate-binding protein [Solwaraspora sp. WMMB335]|uniref:metal ABC transporter substrate-binding protein n=1 Tax=Solwaraspora sp. WMMB335 TaxID=3404118 RepID=UPI003B9326BD
MKAETKRQRLTAVLVLLSTLVGIGACVPGQEPPPPPSQRLDVVVNIFPLRWLADRIGGDLVTVRTIEAEPHEEGHGAADDPLSEPDRELIRRADANLFAGNMSADLRATLEQWRRADPNARLYDISELNRLDLRPGPAELADDLVADRLDPHFWMDPQRMVVAADWVTTQLFSAVTLDEALKTNPDKYKTELEKRHGDVVIELQELDHDLNAALPEECRGRWIVPEHPAFMYLAMRYGLQQFAVSGLWSEDLPVQVRRQREKDLAKLFQADPRPAFFYTIDKDLSDEDRNQLSRLASEYGMTPGVLDSLEEEPAITGPDGKTITGYPDAMRANARNIAREFRCD